MWYQFILLTILLFIQCDGNKVPTILIENAIIIDGTGAERFMGSVRIKGDKIINIGKLKAGPLDTIIDGSGLVLCPGFID